jgi:hypothetical protein
LQAVKVQGGFSSCERKKYKDYNKSFVDSIIGFETKFTQLHWCDVPYNKCLLNKGNTYNLAFDE